METSPLAVCWAHHRLYPLSLQGCRKNPSPAGRGGQKARISAFCDTFSLREGRGEGIKKEMEHNEPLYADHLKIGTYIFN